MRHAGLTLLTCASKFIKRDKARRCLVRENRFLFGSGFRALRGVMYRPFMAVENQVQRLNKRGLQTDTRTPWILEREGYYSVVNGYKDPFLDKEAGIRTHEDQYLPNTSFNELYALFVFDRNLRFLLFRMTTLSEAILKTICSYEFTKEYANEKNPYLNIANYAESGKAHDKAMRLIPKLEKIISLNKDSNFTDGKEYLRHCLEKYEEKCRFGYYATISLLVRYIGFSKLKIALFAEIFLVALLLYIRIHIIMGKRLPRYSLIKYIDG